MYNMFVCFSFFGKEYALENLSSTIVGEIVAPLITYGISKTIENIFEKNFVIYIFNKKFYYNIKLIF